MTALTKIPITHFAPAERMPIEVVHRQTAVLQENPLASTLLNSVLNCVFVLNAQRQIVFASKNVLELTPDKALDQLIGMRPGEALDCVHADDCESGCGTSVFCGQCGAARAILASLAGNRELQECRMTRVIRCQEEAMDLLVLATPLRLNDESFSLLSVAEISHEKRRRALERVFFHDVINLAGGADGLLKELVAQASPETRSDLELTQAAVHDLLEEIETHRDLAAAERDELEVKMAFVQSNDLLAQLAGVYQCHPVAERRQVRVAEGSASVRLVTDAGLLKRVLGNLIKNALEASPEGATVTIGCEQTDQDARFRVHNPGGMPLEVRLQIFKRSFTTKGAGRGLGTYSVKLLTEKYLKGRVEFTTSAERGTKFIISLPRCPERRD